MDLPAMGADPLHKDIFVEVDYMMDDTHSHAFSPAAQEIVMEMFQNAPVQNPDGTTGINIHIDAGRASVMNPVTRERWGDFSRSDSLTHADTLGNIDRNNIYDWREFQKIKKAKFDPLRASSFHYSVFAHDLGGAIGVSGIGEILGNDLIVSLGTGWLGTKNQQAGIFIHELGHNLSLDHAGDSSLPNYKPNYLSVMNYLFGSRGLIVAGIDGNFDYSRFAPLAVNDLVETSLDETRGISASPSLSTYGSLYRCISGPPIVIPSLNTPVDWNCKNGFENNVSTDVNLDSEQGTLRTFDDWSHVRFSYPGGEIGAGAFSDRSNTLLVASDRPLDELTAQEAMSTPAITGVEIQRPAFQATSPGTTITYQYGITNIGRNTDTYQITTTSSNSWADFSSIPTYITLDSGQRIDVVVPVTVPATAIVGTVDIIDIAVQSRSYRRSADSFQSLTTVVADPKTVLCAGRKPTILGTHGDDVLNGTPGTDIIAGLNGNDTLNGLGGNDILCGGNGIDTLDGGAGDDVLEGELGNDTLSGDTGNDTLNGGNGDDTLRGDAGQDQCTGGAGNDTLTSCESGHD